MAFCRSCQQYLEHSILSLGKVPLANALLRQDQLNEPEESFGLDLFFCANCSLVQISETIPPERLFREYFYFSSYSETVLKNASDIAERMIERCFLRDTSLVIEIASNDGYLLQNYCRHDIPVLGVDPAQNIARVAEKRGIPTICEFFNQDLASRLLEQGRQADIIHANNVIAHVADLHSVVEGIRILLKPDGVALIENHYVKDLIDHNEFDSIYHEHLCYYSVTSFRNLFAQHGLVLVDVERIPIHGGSLRVYFQREDGPCTLAHEGQKRVQALLREEMQWGVTDIGFYQNFGEKVERLRSDLISLLYTYKSQGKHIVVYGASAKSTTLLNCFGIGKETLDFVVDRSEVKQGLYTPGTHLPILSPKALLEFQPDFVLLLVWNFAEEVLQQQAEYRLRGGKFIIPIPLLTTL